MAITFKQLGNLGRRGNQMFQAAAVIALAKKHNDDYILPICELTNTTNIPLEKFSNNITFSNKYQEPYFHFKEIPYSLNLNIENSYLQSYRYFDTCKDDIIHLMKSNLNYPNYNDYTSIHVRRTDYVGLKDFHTNLDKDYYEKAINIVNADKYIVVSDDINWCKSIFKGDKFVFAEGNSAQEDQAIMYSCKNNIIANSSFSWWSAYLNNNPNKIVVYPKTWFGPKLQHSIKDLCPPEWIGI